MSEREEFCAGYRDSDPKNDRPCPMAKQPLKMTGIPERLVGNAVGYRCRECRYVFCASCALAHFGMDKPNALAEMEARRIERLRGEFEKFKAQSDTHAIHH